MNPCLPLEQMLESHSPLLALAPMQDITDLPFWRLIGAYGGPDLYFTEYFRVHPVSRLDPTILRSITENPTGCPVIAQLIGNDIPALVRTARELQHYPVAGIDLNLGCPAPVVYRKSAGGGLLREPHRVDAILGALREAIALKFTVKTRLGFDSAEEFDRLLTIFSRHSLDLLTVHGRTVKEGHRRPVNYGLIAQAVSALPFPVLANGDVDSAGKARAVLHRTGARGLMIGRGAIRNPWLFRQIRQDQRNESVERPIGRDVLAYLLALFAAVERPGGKPRAHVEKMKKYLNYIGLGVEPAHLFLHRIRRVESETEFRRVCEDFLDHDQPMRLEPPPNLDIWPSDSAVTERSAVNPDSAEVD